MTESAYTAAPIIVIGAWGLIMVGLLVWFLWPALMEHNSSIRRSNRSTQPDIHSCSRTAWQVRTGVLGIPFAGTLHGPPDRATFGLVEAFRSLDVHGEDVIVKKGLSPSSQKGTTMLLVSKCRLRGATAKRALQ